jgi:hypothetical protein
MRGMFGARSRATWALVALATLALGVIASGALAGKKLKTKSETVEADAGERGFASGFCSPATAAVSGGFEADPVVFGEPTPFYFIDGSLRSGGRSWISEGANIGAIGGAPGTLTSYAYCREERIKSKRVTVSVAPDQAQTVSAKCKRGTKAVSGGFDADDIGFGSSGPFLRITTSRKSGGRTWEVRAANAGDETGELTAQVNCREGKGLKTRQRSAELDNEVFELDAKCKRKQRVVSGGFAGPDLVGPEGLIPFASMKVGKRGWHLAGLVTGEVTVYAYCEKK